MTDYWKSTPKHWCEVCRIWIADTPRIVKEHERSALHQERVSRKLSALRREADKEADEAARVARTMHEIESKAFASYAADLKDQEERSVPTAPPPCNRQKQEPGKDAQLHHKGKRKVMTTTEVPKHPLQDIGGYSMPKSGKIGGQRQKLVRQKDPVHKSKKVRVNEREEEKAKRLRREAQERVKQRNMTSFGLG